MNNINKKLVISLVLVVILAAGLFWFVRDQKDAEEITNNTDQVSEISNFEQCVVAGNPVAQNSTCQTPEGKEFVQEKGNEPEKQELIKVESPRSGQVVASPLEIKGSARGNWYFEGSFPAKLLDANGKQLAIIPIQAQGEWMTTNFVPFKATMSFPVPSTATGTLVLEKDNASGLPQNDDRLVIPVLFAQTAGTTKVQLYFGNSSKGAECEKVSAVTREISKTAAIGRAVLEELLKGPTEQGYSTAINPSTKLNSLKIENGTAYADFSEELNKDVAGSCRVNAIRAQITESLKQFPTVKQVTISVNGKSDGILQP